MRNAVLLLLAVLAVAAAAGAAAADPPPKKAGKAIGGPYVHPRKEDIPYIKCQVCELLAKNARKQVRQMFRTATPSNRVDEMKIIGVMEKITIGWKKEGEWIAHLDLVKEGDKLVVKEMDQVGRCEVECKTIEKAAQQILDNHDTDIAEVLLANKMNRAEFTSWLCHDLTGACKAKPPPLPKGRKPGPPFDPKKDDDQNIDSMLGQMEEMGVHHDKKIRNEMLEKMGAKPQIDFDEMSEIEESLQAAMAMDAAQQKQEL